MVGQERSFKIWLITNLFSFYYNNPYIFNGLVMNQHLFIWTPCSVLNHCISRTLKDTVYLYNAPPNT